MSAFYRVQRERGYVRDFDITRIGAAASPRKARDAVDEIFDLLPPRRALHWYRDRSADDRAVCLAHAYAHRHPPELFLRAARRLVCNKAGESHHVKFPVAVFEDYHHVSPEWRKQVLACSVAVLQGTQMEDDPYAMQAREGLRRL
jgi:hypothetical protein